MNDEFMKSAVEGFGFLIGLGIPVVGGMLIKDFLSNFVAGIQIKMNTNFQYINTFEFDKRANCRVFNIHFSTIEIQDLETQQIITIFNKDFIKSKLWRNIALHEGEWRNPSLRNTNKKN